MSAATIARLKITLDAVTPAVLRRIEVPFDILSTGCTWPCRRPSAGPTAISMRFVPAISAGARLSRSRLARRLSRCAQGASRQSDRRRRHQDAALRLRLWRWLGALDQDRAAPRSTAWHPLSAIDRSQRTLPAGRSRRSVRLCRIPRCHPRSHAQRHAELKQWIGCDFDPNYVHNEGLAAHVAALAKQWAATAMRRARRA